MADWRDSLIKALRGFRGKIRMNEPLSFYTTFGIGGPSDLFVIPENMDDLKILLRAIRDLKIPFIVVGGGSNLLINDKGFRGITISLGKDFDKIEVIDNNHCHRGTENAEIKKLDKKRVNSANSMSLWQQVRVGGATRLSKLVNTLISSSLSGVEFLWWIPGTFGGAVKCNAGAFSSSMEKIVEEIEGIDLKGEIKRLRKKEIGFKYRGTEVEDGFIITQGVLLLKRATTEEIRERLRKVIEYRKETQPLNQLSAGCVFKNPEEGSAGRIIDELGLKGFSIGDAYISEKHANFIINRGGASFNDVVRLIKKIKEAVKEKRGIELKEEIIIIGGNYAKAR